ncbi:hypothetical protein SO694_000661105 [Aureococcus anophagefferens]|uniref:EF-hand domain-containing protein n=1 Tax=Aureococcus anophagefferens TaxID=44056 RepID=A0ABR1FQ93_AURAN
MVKDVNRAELDALEVFVRARQQRLTRCVESDLALQYQVLQCGDRLGERMVARARKKMLLQDEGKTLDDASLLDPVDPYLEAFDSSMTVVPSTRSSSSALFDEIDDDGNGDLTAQEFLEGAEALDALKNGGKQSPRKKLSHEASLQSAASAGTVVTADDKRRPSTEGGGRNQRGRVRSCICR